MRRRVFLSGAILTGVGLPLLAGCRLPWQSGRQAGSTSASASAGKASGTAVPAASSAPQGWQELDAHVMGHHLGFQVSPLVRRDEKTTVLALKLTRAKDDASVKDVVVDSLDKDSNVWTARCFSDSACFVLQAAFFRSRNSLSTSSGVRYPRAE